MGSEEKDRKQRIRFVLPVEEFFGWLPLAALLGMIINDHFLRIKYPNFITGKISDLCVLLFFPALLTASFDTLLFFVSRLVLLFSGNRVFLSYALTKMKVVVSILISGLILIGINTSVYFHDLFLRLCDSLDVMGLLGSFRYTMDLTDLAALAVLPVSLWWGFRTVNRKPLSRVVQDREKEKIAVGPRGLMN